MVTVELDLRTINGGASPNGTILGTLPEGFRPNQALACTYHDSVASALAYQIIFVDGTIRCYGYGSSSFVNASVCISYYVAECGPAT